MILAESKLCSEESGLLERCLRKMAGIYPHSWNFDDPSTVTVGFGISGIPVVHCHQKVGHRGSESLCRPQQKFLLRSAMLTKEVSMNRTGHSWPSAKPQDCRTRKKGRQSGMATD